MIAALLLTLSTPAHAEPPTAEVAGFPAGGGAVLRGSSDADGERVAFVSGGTAVSVHIPTWTVSVGGPCRVTGVAVVDATPDDELWVSCDNGTVRVMRADGEDLVDIGDGTSASTTLSVVEGEADAIHYSAAFDTVYVVVDPDEGFASQVVVIDPEEREIGATVNLGLDGYVTSALGAQTLFIAHRDSLISAMNLGSNTATTNIQGLLIDVVDLAPTVRNTAYAVHRGENPQVAEYLPAQLGYNVAFPSTPGIQSVGISRTEGDEYAVFVYEDRVEPYLMNNGVIGTPLDVFSTTGTARAVLPVPSGYTFVGTAGGEILVMTNRPWVADVTASATDVAEGDEVTISFRVDQPVDWEVALGGTWRSGGQIIDSGSVDAAGEISTTLTVGDWAEGTNDLFVRVTDARGRTGHGRAGLAVDTAPDAPSFSARDISVDSGVLELSFPALDSPDIASYAVYVTTVPFERGDFATGGPAYEGPDELEAPIIVQAPESERVEVDIRPVTNDVTYYLAVRATDEGGLEGPMSDVVEATPQPTVTAADLAGETGGMDCSTTGTGLAGLGLLGLLGAGLVRRRRGLGAAAVLGALALGLSLPAPAHAADDETLEGDTDGDGELSDDEAAAQRRRERLQVYDPDDTGDSTPAWANVEIRYGSLRYAEDNPIRQVHGNSGAFMVEFGPQLFRFVEIDLGGGLIRETDAKLTADGTGRGTSEVTLNVLPFSASGTLRLHVLDEQIFVPYGQYGLDMWVWNQRADNAAGEKDTLSGTQFGTHWAVGGQLLLDIFDRDRASLLEAQTGINDSWLVVEYRQQQLAGEGGFDFSGTLFSAGLKFDF